jgi:hypothetical protein
MQEDCGAGHVAPHARTCTHRRDRYEQRFSERRGGGRRQCVVQRVALHAETTSCRGRLVRHSSSCTEATHAHTRQLDQGEWTPQHAACQIVSAHENTTKRQRSGVKEPIPAAAMQQRRVHTRSNPSVHRGRSTNEQIGPKTGDEGRVDQNAQ